MPASERIAFYICGTFCFLYPLQKACSARCIRRSHVSPDFLSFVTSVTIKTFHFRLSRKIRETLQKIYKISPRKFMTILALPNLKASVDFGTVSTNISWKKNDENVKKSVTRWKSIAKRMLQARPQVTVSATGGSRTRRCTYLREHELSGVSHKQRTKCTCCQVSAERSQRTAVRSHSYGFRRRYYEVVMQSGTKWRLPRTE